MHPSHFILKGTQNETITQIQNIASCEITSSKWEFLSQFYK